MSSVSLAVLGGDKRQIAMIKALEKAGLICNVWGVPMDGEDENRSYEDWCEAIAASNAVVLPLPFSADGVRVNAPLAPHGEGIRLNSLLRDCAHKLLLGGKLSEPFLTEAARYDVRCIDYYRSESLQLKNALATAEGAIEIAMHELPVTLDGCLAAVIGYGRIGELLAQRLLSWGVHVTVCARREEVLTRASLAHCSTLKLDEGAVCHGLDRLPRETCVLFNTVPHRIITRPVLQTLPHDCLLIDLASAPGGIELAQAEELEMKCIWATAIPGKYAPVSAGTYIAQTLVSILTDDGLI